MREINNEDTKKLLSILNNEIDKKCNEIKKQKSEERLKKAFFLSCVIFFMFFIIQVFLKIFSFGYITSFFIYQSIVMIIIVPLLFKAIKGVSLR